MHTERFVKLPFVKDKKLLKVKVKFLIRLLDKTLQNFLQMNFKNAKILFHLSNVLKVTKKPLKYF